MRSPAYAAALIIEDASLATFKANSGWSLSVGVEQDKPATTITVYDTGGEPDMDGNSRPTIQVRVRGTDYLQTYDKAWAILRELDGLHQTQKNLTQFVSFDATTEVISLGRDDNDRFLFTINFVTPNAFDLPPSFGLYSLDFSLADNSMYLGSVT